MVIVMNDDFDLFTNTDSTPNKTSQEAHVEARSNDPVPPQHNGVSSRSNAWKFWGLALVSISGVSSWLLLKQDSKPLPTPVEIAEEQPTPEPASILLAEPSKPVQASTLQQDATQDSPVLNDVAEVPEEQGSVEQVSQVLEAPSSVPEVLPKLPETTQPLAASEQAKSTPEAPQKARKVPVRSQPLPKHQQTPKPVETRQVAVDQGSESQKVAVDDSKAEQVAAEPVKQEKVKLISKDADGRVHINIGKKVKSLFKRRKKNTENTEEQG